MIKIHPMIETPEGLHNAYAIATASSRVEALCLGGEDWAYNCGLERSAAGKELDHVKFEMVTVASRAQVIPIDSVYNWLEDQTGLEQDSINSFKIGMKARATISPKQVKIIDKIYKPSVKTIKWAQNLLSNLKEVEIYGKSCFVSNEVIVDPLAIVQAKQVLANSKDS
jgi:citrate lyase subunit beta/citryl-CoA lyase